MIDKEKFAELAKKYLEGKATPDEKDFLESHYNAMHTGKPLGSVMDEASAGNLKSEMFDYIRSEIGKPSVRHIAARRRHLRYTAVAASLLAICIAAFLLRPGTKSPDNKITIAQTNYIVTDTMQKLLLNDGTMVWLNAKSRLRYPADLGKRGQRDVYLEGEAYFEVKSDKLHPFLVHTQGLTTRVLGTKFDVKAYNPKSIEVTLVEGKVMLTAGTPAAAHRPGAAAMDTLFLGPNERAVFIADKLQSMPSAKATGTPDSDKQHLPASGLFSGTAALSKHTVMNASHYASWRNGELIFDREPLGSVLETLGRKLDVSIKAAPDLLDYPVSIRITSQSIDNILFEITRQVKRKKPGDHQPYEPGTQYKKTGSEYYIE